jgi:preprotein translocase subunit SecF
VTSSIALATPLLVDLTMRDSRYRKQAERVFARRANLANKAAAAAGDTAEGDDGPESFDQDTLDAELRRERAMAAAGGVPARNARASERRRNGQPQSKRPSGKRRK